MVGSMATCSQTWRWMVTESSESGSPGSGKKDRHWASDTAKPTSHILPPQWCTFSNKVTSPNPFKNTWTSEAFKYMNLWGNHSYSNHHRDLDSSKVEVKKLQKLSSDLYRHALEYASKLSFPNWKSNNSWNNGSLPCTLARLDFAASGNHLRSCFCSPLVFKNYKNKVGFAL